MARKRKLVLWSVGAVVALASLAVGAYAYDAAREDVIPNGVRVAGLSVGGLTSDEARTRLRATLAPRLQRPVTVTVRRRRHSLSPSRARIAPDIESMVAAAVRKSRSSAFPVRVWRGISGGRVEADIPARVSYSRAAVERFARRLERSVDRRPRNASVELASPLLPVGRARNGLDLDGRRLRVALVRAIRSTGNARSVAQRTKPIRPKVTKADLVRKHPTFITIDRSSFRLRLFKRLKLVRTYRIGVGRAGFETPTGVYRIQNKAVNPSWSVPNKPWAGNLAGRVIPPGPENPIKSRWMGIYDGAGIHGTSDTASIGTAASHGCIRMLISEVEQLYDRVPVKTPIYIT